MVFQHYALFPHMTVYDNLAFPLRTRGVTRAETDRRVEEALARVRLPGYGARFPAQLSGGQQQRVALARALVYGPPVLLMDEPLGALDKKLREAMQVELKSLQRQVGITTIFVTHDQEEALTMSDRIAVMQRGRLQQFATPQEIYEAPRNRFVAEFIGVCNFLEGRVAGRDGSALLLRTDAGDLVPIAAPEGRSPGEGTRVVASIRPEKLHFRTAGPGAAGGLRARLETLVYVGTAVHFHLRTASGERLIVYRQNDSAPPPGLAPGAEVQITWEASAARLLPE